MNFLTLAVDAGALSNIFRILLVRSVFLYHFDKLLLSVLCGEVDGVFSECGRIFLKIATPYTGLNGEETES